jgi:hypothetical protein
MLGVLIGALIVILVGGGILFATGALEPGPTNVTIQQPAPATAPAVPERADRDDRRDDRRGDWRDDRRGDRDNDRRDGDGPGRR